MFGAETQLRTNALLLALLSLPICSCRISPSIRAGCPELQAAPASFDIAIKWEDDDGDLRAKARIVSLAVECLPVMHPSVETSKFQQREYSDYEIRVTATVNYQTFDTPEPLVGHRKPMEANIIFEAVSSGGVVLGSDSTRFQAVRNGSLGKASGKISGLSGSEIRRVVAVQARWEYRR